MKPNKYSTLDDVDDIDDIDLENDSDTTLASDGFLGKNNIKRIQKSVKSSRLQLGLTWFRWSVLVLLQGFIIILLLPTSGTLSDTWSSLAGGLKGGFDPARTETGGDINGLYIPSKSHALPSKYNACLSHFLSITYIHATYPRGREILPKHDIRRRQNGH
jgi:hypothetical protein